MSARMHMRKFDHDVALADYRAGATIPQLARENGVTNSAIRQVVVPGAREAAVEATRRYQSRTCVICGGPAVFGPGQERSRHRCRACAAKDARTAVRETELLCFKCREWKPDDDFPRGHVRHLDPRRGRHNYCRACNTAARREYRDRVKVPCLQCGAPCLPANEKGRNRRDSGLCLACYRASRSKAVTA